MEATAVAKAMSEVKCAGPGIGNLPCAQPVDPPGPRGEGAPGDSFTYCPACVLGVLESVREGIASGDMERFATLARACPGLVEGARLSDAVLRFVIAARLLQPEGDGAGGKRGGGGGSGKGKGRSRSSGAAEVGKGDAKSKEVEEEAEHWFNNTREKATIEWDGVLEHMLFSNPLHIAAFEAASASARTQRVRVSKIIAVFDALQGSDVAVEVLRGKGGDDAIGGGKGRAKAATGAAPPAHRNAMQETPHDVWIRGGGDSEVVRQLMAHGPEASRVRGGSKDEKGGAVGMKATGTRRQRGGGGGPSSSSRKRRAN